MAHSHTVHRNNPVHHTWSPSLAIPTTEPLYQHIAYLESEAAYYERTSRYDHARSAYRDIARTLAAIDDITSSVANESARLA